MPSRGLECGGRCCQWRRHPETCNPSSRAPRREPEIKSLMRFVLLALSRPLTVVITLIAVASAWVLAIRRMPVDIFPQVGDPAIYVAQPYGGMDPAQMEG